MTRTDLCPIFSQFVYDVRGKRYGQVYCNHGFPGSISHIEEHAWLKCADPEVDRCAFWNKCKRENGWDDD